MQVNRRSTWGRGSQYDAIVTAIVKAQKCLLIDGVYFFGFLLKAIYFQNLGFFKKKF